MLRSPTQSQDGLSTWYKTARYRAIARNAPKVGSRIVVGFRVYQPVDIGLVNLAAEDCSGF